MNALRSLSGLFALKLISVFTSLAINVLLARILGASEFGEYVFILSVVTLISIPIQFGLPDFILRETAIHAEKNEIAQMRGVWQWANGIIFLSIFFLIGFTLFFQNILQAKLSHPIVLYMALATIPIVAFGGVRSASLRGLGKVSLSIMPETIVRPIIFLAFLTLCLLLDWDLTSANAMGMYVFSAFIGFSFGTLMLIRHAPKLQHYPKIKFQHATWLRSIGIFGMTGSVYIVNTNLDVIMLGWLKTSQDVGIYKIAVIASGSIVLGLQVVEMVISPKIAAFYTAKDFSGLQRLITESARIVSAFSFAIGAILVLFSSYIVRSLMGEEFSLFYYPMIILMAGHLFRVIIGSVGPLLNMTGNEKDSLFGVLISLLVNIAFNLLLIPSFGMYGAALASTIALMTWNLILFYKVKSKLGVDSTPFANQGAKD